MKFSCMQNLPKTIIKSNSWKFKALTSELLDMLYGMLLCKKSEEVKKHNIVFVTEVSDYSSIAGHSLIMKVDEWS